MRNIYVYFEYTSCDYSCRPKAFNDYESALAWLKKSFDEAKEDAESLDQAELLTGLDDSFKPNLLAQAFIADDCDNWCGEIWKVELN